MSTIQSNQTETNVTLSILRIKDLNLNSARTRVALNLETVKEYALAMGELEERRENGETIDPSDEFPPLVVFFDGKTFWLGDGLHRVAAAKLAGIKYILCDLRDGHSEDAWRFSIRANMKHGLRRTYADKRDTVSRMLGDNWYGEMRCEDIADLAGVSPDFVDDIEAGKNHHELPCVDIPFFAGDSHNFEDDIVDYINQTESVIGLLNAGDVEQGGDN